MNDATWGDALGEAAAQNMVCEVVGVFDTTAGLDAAVERLGMAGIDRAALSVLGAEGPHNDETDTARRSVWAISDDPATPTTALISHGSQSEARGMAIAVPMEIAGFGAAWAAAAAGGALIVAIGATVASGAVGAGLGALLYHAVARGHARAIHDQLTLGGLILWVRVSDKATEERVLTILRDGGAGSVHAHMIDRPWGVANSPLSGVQPDPFLERDPNLHVA